MRFSAICIAAITIASAAEAADQSQKLSITVYNNNLALVQDERRLDVPAGRTRLEFKDVSASIKPETVALSGAGFGVVEQNFDYDLLTPSKMMEKAVGHEIEIVRTIPGTRPANARKADRALGQRAVSCFRIGNRIEVLSADGIPDAASSSTAFLKICARSRHFGDGRCGIRRAAHDVTLSYLTTGLSWKADYVALFDEKQSALKPAGLGHAHQQFGHELQGRETQLVAGDINIFGSMTRTSGSAACARDRSTAAATQASEQAVDC